MKREREREKNQVERDSLVNEEGQINEIRTAQYALLRFRRAWKCSSYLSQFFFFISILVFVFGFFVFFSFSFSSSEISDCGRDDDDDDAPDLC